eukprot:gene24608-biopygen4428
MAHREARSEAVSEPNRKKYVRLLCPVRWVLAGQRGRPSPRDAGPGVSPFLTTVGHWIAFPGVAEIHQEAGPVRQKQVNFRVQTPGSPAENCGQTDRQTDRQMPSLPSGLPSHAGKSYPAPPRGLREGVASGGGVLQSVRCILQDIHDRRGRVGLGHRCAWLLRA